MPARAAARESQTYPCVTAAAAGSMAGDHGRKLHELPWLYLDSVGQEYGPVPGWTMREWLRLGRFPVGGDLRVRLPEWERHLPLHQLYADLNTAFVLPPAWPDIYEDGVLKTEDDPEDLLVLSRIKGLASGQADGAAVGSRAAADGLGANLLDAGRPGADLTYSGVPGRCTPGQEESLLPPPPPVPSHAELEALMKQPEDASP